MPTSLHGDTLGTAVSYRTRLLAALVAIAATAVWFATQAAVGLNLGDEGYLWYGMQRVGVGEVPIRDFMAYDPARYYWSNAVASIWGDSGILALRVGLYLVQALGLLVALLLLAHRSKEGDALALIAFALVLSLWMLPRHKVFDITSSVVLVAGVALLLARPTRTRWFQLGLLVGFAAFVGRNHGVYGVLGSMLALAYFGLRRGDSPRLTHSFAAWSTGVVIGYLPLILMLLLVQDFADAFWESIRYLFEFGSTNLALPVPWPWADPPTELTVVERLRYRLIGCWFVAMVGFGVVGTGIALLRRFRNCSTDPVLVASAFLALPYAQHALSRADVWHLAQGIFPALLGFMLLAAGAPKRLSRFALGLILFASAAVMFPLQPAWQCRSADRCVTIEVAGDTLRVSAGVAADIGLINQLVADHASENGSFMTVPLWPGAYALFARPSPIWEIYPLTHRSDDFQQAEIARIESAQPRFVAVLDVPLDGREELRFRNTHPMVYQYVIEHYRALNAPETQTHLELFVPWTASQP